MKGAHGHGDVLTHKRSNAMPHLVGGAVGEGDGEDGVRRVATYQETVRDMASDDARLAAPRSGEDEERTPFVQHDEALLGVQAGKQTGVVLALDREVPVSRRW